MPSIYDFMLFAFLAVLAGAVFWLALTVNELIGVQVGRRKPRKAKTYRTRKAKVAVKAKVRRKRRTKAEMALARVADSAVAVKRKPGRPRKVAGERTRKEDPIPVNADQNDQVPAVN